jgi:hypothetical protein
MLLLTILDAVRNERKSLRQALDDVCLKAVCYLDAAVNKVLWVVGLQLITSLHHQGTSQMPADMHARSYKR